jgi:hypothetical protein
MTRQQASLLRRCIYAARYAQQAREENCHQHGHRWQDFELVEVAGKFNGVDPRTADSLVEAGVLTTDLPGWASEYTHTHVRLPRLDELEARESLSKE